MKDEDNRKEQLIEEENMAGKASSHSHCYQSIKEEDIKG
jgi:hypothetical protein